MSLIEGKAFLEIQEIEEKVQEVCGSSVIENPLLIDMQQTFADCLATAVRKNHDYSGDRDPFGNISNSITVGVAPERAILVRMMDKISRISNLLDKEAAVKDESVDDTLMDLINYTAILKAYRKLKR